MDASHSPNITAPEAYGETFGTGDCGTPEAAASVSTSGGEYAQPHNNDFCNLRRSALTCSTSASAADIKVLTTGAMKSVVLAVADEFKKASGHTLVVDNDTAGALVKRIEGGEVYDDVGADLARHCGPCKENLVAGNGTPIARVGVGVMVKAGAWHLMFRRSTHSSARCWRRRPLATSIRQAVDRAAFILPSCGNS